MCKSSLLVCKSSLLASMKSIQVTECNLFNPPRNTNREKDNGTIAAKNGYDPFHIAAKQGHLDGMRGYEWKCPTYGNVNFSFRTIFNIRKHNTPKPESQVAKLAKSSKKANGAIAAKNGLQPMKIERGNSVASFAMAVSSGPGPQLLTPRTISSGLVLNPPSPTPYVPPDKKVWDILFQPMFDEYFNPSPSVASPVPVVAAPEPADSTCTPSSTTNDQDAPSPKLSSGESSSRDVIPTNVHSVNQPPEHLRK
nr:hypothetical protein [Tanacetum cinerariifolium]